MLMNIHASPVPTPKRNPVAAYFADRWRGEVPLAILFWRDMMAFGTLINAVMTIGAVVLLAMKVPAPIAVAVHFATMPYNIFLLVAVWRTADRNAGMGALPGFARVASAVWIVLASII